MSRTIAALLALAALSGTAAAAPRPSLAERQDAALAKALDGKTPGKPQSCVSLAYRSDALRAVKDDVLLYRIDKTLTYRNDLSNACTGISRGSTLVLRPMGSQYCRGDIAYSVDLTTGMRGASCVLGDFVPYRSERK